MGDKRVFEGRAEEQHEGSEWWSLEADDEDGNCSSDAAWFEGLDGKRVRVTVEVLDDAEPNGGG